MNPGIYATIAQWIPPHSRVLDLGTGDGAFLEQLIRERQVTGEGVEKDAALVTRCMERGLVVHQGDIADGLDQLPMARSTLCCCWARFRSWCSRRRFFTKPFAWAGR